MSINKVVAFLEKSVSETVVEVTTVWGKSFMIPAQFKSAFDQVNEWIMTSDVFRLLTRFVSKNTRLYSEMARAYHRSPDGSTRLAEILSVGGYDHALMRSDDAEAFLHLALIRGEIDGDTHAFAMMVLIAYWEYARSETTAILPPEYFEYKGRSTVTICSLFDARGGLTEEGRRYVESVFRHDHMIQPTLEPLDPEMLSRFERTLSQLSASQRCFLKVVLHPPSSEVADDKSKSAIYISEQLLKSVSVMQCAEPPDELSQAVCMPSPALARCFHQAIRTVGDPFLLEPVFGNISPNTLRDQFHKIGKHPLGLGSRYVRDVGEQVLPSKLGFGGRLFFVGHDYFHAEKVRFQPERFRQIYLHDGDELIANMMVSLATQELRPAENEVLAAWLKNLAEDNIDLSRQAIISTDATPYFRAVEGARAMCKKAYVGMRVNASVLQHKETLSRFFSSHIAFRLTVPDWPIGPQVLCDALGEGMHVPLPPILVASFSSFCELHRAYREPRHFDFTQHIKDGRLFFTAMAYVETMHPEWVARLKMIVAEGRHDNDFFRHPLLEVIAHVAYLKRQITELDYLSLIPHYAFSTLERIHSASDTNHVEVVPVLGADNRWTVGGLQFLRHLQKFESYSEVTVRSIMDGLLKLSPFHRVVFCVNRAVFRGLEDELEKLLLLGGVTQDSEGNIYWPSEMLMQLIYPFLPGKKFCQYLRPRVFEKSQTPFDSAILEYCIPVPSQYTDWSGDVVAPLKVYLKSHLLRRKQAVLDSFSNYLDSVSRILMSDDFFGKMYPHFGSLLLLGLNIFSCRGLPLNDRNLQCLYRVLRDGLLSREAWPAEGETEILRKFGVKIERVVSEILLKEPGPLYCFDGSA